MRRKKPWNKPAANPPPLIPIQRMTYQRRYRPEDRVLSQVEHRGLTFQLRRATFLSNGYVDALYRIQ